MRRQYRRTGLVGSASAIAIVAAMTASASAQTVTNVNVNVLATPIEITGSVAGSNVDNSLDAILNLQPASGATAIAVTEDNNTAGTVNVNLVPFSVDMDDNTIFATATANNELGNSITVLPAAPVGFAVDGLAILSAQVADDIDIYADNSGNTIDGEVNGPGAGDASFTGNALDATGSFNRAVNTIAVDSSNDLETPTSGLVDFGLPTTTQTATFSIVNAQVNSDFGHVADADAIANVDEATIVFERVTNGGAGANVFTGAFDLSDNTINARARSNSADSLISVGGDDANGFGGTAMVTNVQGHANSDDAEEIDAEVDDALVQFVFRRAALGGGSIGGAVDLSVLADDNAIGSEAIINNARNEVALDGSLILTGVSSTPGQQVIRMTGFAPDLVEADYAVSNLQILGDPDSDALQGADGETFDSVIEVLVEDVNASSSFSFEGNSLTSSAGGNNATNLVGNGTGGASSAQGVAANFNFQVAEAINADAEVADDGDGSRISFIVGRTSDGGDIFGGFEGSSLSAVGNSIAASAFGNQAVSANNFDAVALTMQFDSGGNLNDGANVNSNTGETGPTGNYRASAGSAILSFQDLDAGSDPTEESVGALVDNSDLQILVNDVGAPDAGEGLSTAVIDVNLNRLSAAAVGNSFTGVNELSADSSLTGTGATLAVQRADTNSVEADLVETDLSVLLGYGTATADNLALSVSGNGVTAIASINQSSTQSSIETLSFLGGADGNASNATVFGSDSGTTEIAGFNRARADSALTTISDQYNEEGVATASVDDAEVEIIIGDGGADGTLADSALSIVSNTIGAQARANQASNTTTIEALTATTEREGALAGIVSQQVNTGADAPDILDVLAETFGAGAYVLAVTVDTDLLVQVTQTDTSDLTFAGNRALANAAGNLATNSLVIDAGSLTQVTASTTGANLSVTTPNSTGDVELDVDSAGAFVVNTQRNEALDPGAPDAPTAAGPTVVSLLGGDIDAPVGNTFAVVVGDGVADSNLTDSSLDVLGNAMLATARANDASNSLAIGSNSGGANGGLLNNQINSGSVFAGNGLSSITTTLNGLDNDTVSVTMDGNQIGSSATGSNAVNALSATSSAAFGGVAVAGAAPVASVSGSGTNVLNNGEIEANGNLVLVNSQTSYGVDGGQEIFSQTIDAEIALNAEGDTTDGAYSLSGNGIVANASANTASNSITASAATGGLPSATLVSVQQSTGVTVAAGVSGANVSATIGGTGALLGGSASISGNSIGSTASINSGTNTIGSAGQSFTRTASF